MLVQMSGWQGAQALHAEGGSAVAYTGMMDCLVRTVKEEGVRALFKVGCLFLQAQCILWALTCKIPERRLNPACLHLWLALCLSISAGRALGFWGVLLPRLQLQVHCLKADALLQGLWPNYIKVVPSIAIAFVTYEKLKEGLGVELRISS
jgi:hypothetical protein